MSKKAVYSNKGLQVYITAEDFEFLLERGQMVFEVHIGKSAVSIGHGFIHLRPDTVDNLENALALEQAAIDKARSAGQVKKIRYDDFKSYSNRS